MLIWWRHIVHFCQISHCTPRTCSYWVSAKVNSSPYDRNADTFTYYFGVFYLCFVAWGNTRPENELWVPEFQMSATDLEEELRRDGITSMIKTWHLTVSLPDPHMSKWCPSMCSQADTAGPSLAWYYSSSQTAFITGQQDFLLGRVYEMPLPITLNTKTLTSLISLPVPLCSGLKPNLSKCGSTLRVSGKYDPTFTLLFPAHSLWIAVCICILLFGMWQEMRCFTHLMSVLPELLLARKTSILVNKMCKVERLLTE